jgi:hypothetical protein
MNIRTQSAVLLSLFILIFGAIRADAANAVGLEVILVRASEGEASVDSNLRPYVSTLQRLFRFDRYERLSRKSLMLDGSQTVRLHDGQSVQLNLLESNDRSARIELEWLRGSTRLLSTRVQVVGNLPAVLGGPRGEEGILLLLVVRK